MADCFISYATQDERFARFVYDEMVRHNLSAFMAAVSLEPGVRWSDDIRKQLLASNWVVFLASQKASASPYVQQELGMALGGGKKIVPIVWDMSPTDLPGWIKEVQAIDLRDASPDETRDHVAGIAKAIAANKQQGYRVLAAIVAAFFLFGGDG